MRFLKVVIVIFSLIFYSSLLSAQKITSACICEEISGGQPKFSGVVFSSSLKKIYCYTMFSDVKKETFIYHVWYFKDKLVSKVKLKLKPPSWATFSRIYIRDSDIGPWRVDILEEEGKLISTLRFSVVE